MTSKKMELSAEFLAAVLLYRIIETDEEIPLEVKGTDFEYFENELKTLAKAGAIESNDENIWQATEVGIAKLDRMIDVFENLLDLDIFAGVNLSLELPDELFDEDGNIAEEELDPRFDEPQDEAEAEVFGTTDLRLPIIDFLAQRLRKESNASYSPEDRQAVLSRMIFVLELGSDKYADDETFFDLKLGAMALEIDEIASSVPPWIDLAGEFSPPEKLMEMIIQAGFLDAAKRELIEDEEACVWFDNEKQNATLLQLLTPLV